MKVITHVGLLLLTFGLLAFGLSGCGDDETIPSGNGGQDTLDGDTGEGDTNPADTGNDTSNTGSGADSLMPSTDGWVDMTESGFQGAWYTYTDNNDGGNSTINPPEGEPFTNDGSICIDGEASLVVDEEWSTYWGAGVGMDLCATTADDDPPEHKYILSECPNNADLANQFKGVEFDIEGEWGSELRCSFKEVNRDESAYVEVASGHNECLVADAQVWYDTSKPLTDVTQIEALQFQIATNQDAAVPFDFCITNLKAVMAK